jgi:hypothetical protein
MSWDSRANDADWDSGADYLRRLKASQQQTIQPANPFAPPSERETAAAPGQSSPELKLHVGNTDNCKQQERRRSPRFKCEGSAEFRVGDTDVRTWGTFTDLSVHGCYIEMTATFPVGAMVDLVLGLNGIRAHVKGEIRVSYPFLGMGVVFREVSPENERALQAMVRSLVVPEGKSSGKASPEPASPAQASIPVIASPAVALQAMVDFFEAHTLLSKDEFLQLIRKSQSGALKHL